MRYVLILGLVGLFGCASRTQLDVAPTAQDSALVAQTQLRVVDDQFATTIQVVGAAYTPPDTKTERIALRSMIDKRSHDVMHDVIVVDNYNGDWRFWESANGEGGEPLQFASWSRDVEHCAGGRYGFCMLRETFGAFLTDSLLRAHRTGYAVKFYARTGTTFVAPLTEPVIAANLAAVDSIRATMKP